MHIYRLLLDSINSYSIYLLGLFRLTRNRRAKNIQNISVEFIRHTQKKNVASLLNAFCVPSVPQSCQLFFSFSETIKNIWIFNIFEVNCELHRCMTTQRTLTSATQNVLISLTQFYFPFFFFLHSARLYLSLSLSTDYRFFVKNSLRHISMPESIKYLIERNI